MSRRCIGVAVFALALLWFAGPTQGQTVYINFQPAGSEVPEGYLPDTGQVFGDRGNGFSYGWDHDTTADTRDRAIHADPRYDTTDHFSKNGDAIWEIALQNGDYNLLIVCGDAGYTDQTNTLDVEGLIIEDPNAQTGNFDKYTVTVEVADGRLTVTPGPGASNAKICFIDIVLATLPQAASSPNPANGTPDVPRDSILAWEAGDGATAHDVYFGTVFEDVDAATRTNPMGVLISQGQPEATFDPGRLEFSQVYYWRVDEVVGATIYKGDLWSFTVEPFAYAIEGVVATTNAISTAGQGPENVVNGSGLNENDEHSIESTTMWTAKPDANEVPYIQFEFDRVYKMYEMLVWNHNMSFEFLLGIGLRDVTVEYSTDGIDWMALGDVELAQASGSTTYTGSPVALDGIAAKFIRLTINSNYRGAEGTDFGLSEIRFMYIRAFATEPDPADGATDADVNTTLSWRAGRDAATHEVYLGTDAGTLELVGIATENSYDPGSLDYGTTYAWQVVEVNEADSLIGWAGDVWTFSTPDYLVVDDFEAYDDDIDAGTTIWQAWADGLEDPANGGSMVGNDPSPFAELVTVHSGAQAMPLYYSTALSEADFSIRPAQNWTAQGLKSLSLWFYGAAGNTGQLYVKINGVKVPYTGDAGDIARPVWLPFNIDLTTINGAQSVTSMTIGIENATTEGLLLVDDVRLYPKLPEVIMPVEPDAAALLAHYEFEGNANDTSGNGLNGTLTDAEVVATGAPGLGMGLQVNDGGYVDLGNPPALDFATEDWAAAAWFKTAMFGTGDVNKGCIVGKGGDTGGGHRWCLIMSEATEGVVSLICDDDVVKVETHSTSVTNDDEWHAVVGQRVGETTEIYIDGQLEKSSTTPAGYDLSGTVQHNAYIGVITDHDPDTLYKTYDGLVDDVRIYHQSLSAGEILWLNGETEPRPKPF